MVMTGAVSDAPAVVMTVERPRDEPSMLTIVTGVGLVLLLAALVSWLAARYLNRAMAPRRLWLRVVAAGALPVGILIGGIIMVGISQGRGITSATAGLWRVPLTGKLLMLAMLGTGLGVSWMTAVRRNRREERQVNAALEALE